MLSFLQEPPVVSFDQARVVILPVPFEATVSYGTGTAQGPTAILRASQQVEFYDERLACEPRECGIWTEPPLAVAGLAPAAAVERIAQRFGELIDDGKWVAMLGGEHTITPGGVRAAASRWQDLHLVQLDAHADLRESYEGEAWSHACAMARCLEHVPLRAIGIRSYSREEAERMQGGIAGYRVTHAWQMSGPGWIDRALEGLDGKPIYLTVDVDFFDPAVIPATGTPEPGGGRWWPTLRLLERLFERGRVVGCDVVELAPEPTLRYADFAAARLVYKLIGLAWRSGSLDTARGR
jgi:agmatinase